MKRAMLVLAALAAIGLTASIAMADPPGHGHGGVSVAVHGHHYSPGPHYYHHRHHGPAWYPHVYRPPVVVPVPVAPPCYHTPGYYRPYGGVGIYGRGFGISVGF